MKEITPGPWHWHNCGGHHILVSGPASEEGRYPDGPQVISDGSAGGEYSPDIDVDGPDARLIAAAPELLAALEDMLAGWQYIRNTHGDLYGVGWDRCEESASAAINKAKGETP